MKTIKVNIPQVVFETVSFQLSDDEAAGIPHMSDYDKAKLTMQHMTETQCDWLPNGEKSLRDSFEYGFTTMAGYKDQLDKPVSHE